MSPQREDRLSDRRSRVDQRAPFQLDRDRILYSAAFRRLAGVTQVVSPGEGEVFHNRLTHTLKVAQISRRLAEMLLNRPDGKTLAEAWGGIDPEVVEAAALAHDLGHPPFGHLAEEELNHLVAATTFPEKSDGNRTDTLKPVPQEGYEGNAQSFRIISLLSVRRPNAGCGLDLTRATLNATLKYPRLFSAGDNKYGAYKSEEEPFNFARAIVSPGGTNARSIEAQIMDWADDITYSVHDTEDFYRAGLIPLERLAVNPKERGDFLERMKARRKKIGKPLKDDAEFDAIFKDFFDTIPLREPYRGTRSQQEALYLFTSQGINEFVQGTSLREPPGEKGEGLAVDKVFRQRVELLKELTWCYAINAPALASQQHGQRQAIRTLFDVFDKAAASQDWPLFPALYREQAIDLYAKGELGPARRARLVADTIAAMTDQQALRLYQRLSGLSQGSVFDPIVT